MIDRIQGFEASLGSQAGHLKETALDVAASARERMSDSTQAMKNFVIEQPARALGIALGMGVLLGWLIKRR